MHNIVISKGEQVSPFFDYGQYNTLIQRIQMEGDMNLKGRHFLKLLDLLFVILKFSGFFSSLSINSKNDLFSCICLL